MWKEMETEMVTPRYSGLPLSPWSLRYGHECHCPDPQSPCFLKGPVCDDDNCARLEDALRTWRLRIVIK